MSVYTISSDLVENIKEDEKCYLSDVLYAFINRANCLKAAIDEKGLILDKYKQVTKYQEFIKNWLDLMSFSPSRFEIIHVDLSGIDSNEEFFLTLCKNTRGDKKMIIYSFQDILNYEIHGDKIDFQGEQITLLDKDQARTNINTKQVINIFGSQVAGGSIIGGTNKPNNL